MSDIKRWSCPNCGNKSDRVWLEYRKIIYSQGDGWVWVQVKCQRCQTAGPVFNAHEKFYDQVKSNAIDAWNNMSAGRLQVNAIR